MLDLVEAGNFDNFYGNFVKMVLPLRFKDFLHPKSTSQKVQSYLYFNY